MTRYSEHLRHQALDLFNEGLGYKATARNLNVPVYTVRDWYRGFHSGNFSWLTYKKTRIPEGYKKVVVNTIIENSMGIKEAARKFKISPASIRIWLNKYHR